MIKIKFGNHKLGDDTAIFNMCAAEDCPSKKLGLCEVVKKGITCYADKAERTYPAVKPFRRCQQAYWRNTSARRITQDIIQRIGNRRKPTRYFRFNESGDFNDQQDIEKLSEVSKGLKTIGVTTYGYTARSDLSYQGASFLVKSSGWTGGPNGSTTVIGKYEKVPEGYIECPGSCKKCNLCKINVPHNIAFRKH